MTTVRPHRSGPTTQKQDKNEAQCDGDVLATFFVMMKLVPMATEPDRESTRPIYLSSTIVASSDAHTSMESDAGCGWGGSGTEERRQ